MNNYSINPIKGALLNLDKSTRYINELNDRCTEICDSFGNNGFYSPTSCNNICKNAVTDLNIKNGYSEDYPRRPLKPPMFNQTSHYFPSLFFNNPNKIDVSTHLKNSKKKCIELCKLPGQLYPLECIRNCNEDAMSIVLPTSSSSSSSSSSIPIPETPTMSNITNETVPIINSTERKKNNNNILFGIVLIIVMLIVGVILYRK